MKKIRAATQPGLTPFETGTIRCTGFTLIEVMIAMALLSLLSGAIISVFSSMSRAYTTEVKRSDVQQDLRLGQHLTQSRFQ